MQTVGADQRPEYYLLSPAAVLEELGGHPMGLTNAEADRRRTHQGENTLPFYPLPPRLVGALQREWEYLILLFVAVLLAAYLGQALVVGVLSVVILVRVAISYHQARPAKALINSFTTLLPTSASVLRNDNLHTTEARRLVVGDIVHIKTGDVVPADLRILNERRFATDEKVLLGGSPHTLKFSHALPAAVPLLSRNNLAWMGTTVASGEAYGIVVGTGADTELGRIAHQASTVPEVVTPLERSFRRVAQTSLWAALTLALLLLVISWQTGADEHMFALILLTLLIAFVPIGVSAIWWLLAARLAIDLNRLGLRVRTWSDLERLRDIDMLLFDAHAFADHTRTVSSLLIGRTKYSVTNEGYNPDGKLLDKSQKRVFKKDIQAMSLVFEASTLAHQADVFEPDGKHKGWFAHGDHTEAALLTLARKAGLQTEKLRDSHHLIRTLPFDHHHLYGGTVRQYGDDEVLFVYGVPETVLGQSTRIWDHGHIRNLSANDHIHFRRHLAHTATAGNTSIALAYRILPKNIKAATADTSRLEQKLTLLAIVDIAHAKHDRTINLLHAAHGTQLKVSLLSAEHSPYSVTSVQLRQMTARRLLERLRRGTATFTGQTSEQKVHLVEVAQAAGRHIAVTGSSLSDFPAALQADAAVTSQATPRLLRSAATTATDSPELLLSAIHMSKITVDGLRRMWQTATGQLFALVPLVLLATAATLVFHVPFALSPLLLLAFWLLAQPVQLWVLGTQGSARRHRERFDHTVALLFGLLVATLAYGNFLFFFTRSSLSPVYLDPGNPLVAHGATLVLVTIILCARTSLIFSHRTQPIVFDRPARQSLTAFITSLFITLAIVYWPAAQQVLGTQNLDPADWLCALAAAGIYAAFCLMQHHTRHHTRRAVIHLHQTKFGKTSPARI